MSGVIPFAALGVVIAWVVFALAGLALASLTAILIGIAVGIGSVTLFAKSLPIGALIALLAPFGVMLPALALRHMGASLGIAVQPFATVELLAFALIYAAFLAAALGLVPLDLYRYGYAPVPVAIMVLALCGYGALTGNLFIPLVAVLGQIAWALGWGSSNWFDEVLHATLMPTVLIVLILRVF